MRLKSDPVSPLTQCLRINFSHLLDFVVRKCRTSSTNFRVSPSCRIPDGLRLYLSTLAEDGGLKAAWVATLDAGVKSQGDRRS